MVQQEEKMKQEGNGRGKKLETVSGKGHKDASSAYLPSLTVIPSTVSNDNDQYLLRESLCNGSVFLGNGEKGKKGEKDTH